MAIKLPETFSRYNPPPSSPADVGEQSLTHVECQKECDINYLVRRYTQTGSWGNGDNRLPLDGLNGFAGDFQQMMDQLVEAQEAFDGLPSSVRDRFANDPGRLLDFLRDESNRDEAVKLGLVRVRDPEPQPAPQNAGVVESGTRGE